MQSTIWSKNDMSTWNKSARGIHLGRAGQHLYWWVLWHCGHSHRSPWWWGGVTEDSGAARPPCPHWSAGGHLTRDCPRWSGGGLRPRGRPRFPPLQGLHSPPAQPGTGAPTECCSSPVLPQYWTFAPFSSLFLDLTFIKKIVLPLHFYSFELKL